MVEQQMEKIRDRLSENDIDGALMTDELTVFFCGCSDYHYMDFGCPPILAVPR